MQWYNGGEFESAEEARKSYQAYNNPYPCQGKALSTEMT